MQINCRKKSKKIKKFFKKRLTYKKASGNIYKLSQKKTAVLPTDVG